MKLASGFCIPEPLPVHMGIKGQQVHPLIRFLLRSRVDEMCADLHKPFIFYLFLVGVTVQSPESFSAAIPLGTSTKRANSKRANHGRSVFFKMLFRPCPSGCGHFLSADDTIVVFSVWASNVLKTCSWMTHAPVVGVWAWLRCDLAFPFSKDWHPLPPPVLVSLARAEWSSVVATATPEPELTAMLAQAVAVHLCPRNAAIWRNRPCLPSKACKLKGTLAANGYPAGSQSQDTQIGAQG